jgi:hypothetical protein
VFEVIIRLEDSLKEVVELPGNMTQIEGAVLRKVFELRDTHHDRLSRQSVLSRGFIGTEKKS